MRYIIRQATVGDAAAIARIYGYYIVNTAITFEEQVVDAAAMARRVEETLEKYPYLVAETGGEVMGYAYAGAHGARVAYRWAVNVAIYLDGGYLRRGIGRSLYGVLLPLLARQGYVTACAGVTLPNAASVGVHESVGFKPVGVYHNVGFKLGAWRDVGWWERALLETAENPAEPTAWGRMPAFRAVEVEAGLGAM